MKTLYGLLRERCGLSLEQAARFHNVSHNTVVSWGRHINGRTPPAGIITELRVLFATMEAAADQCLAQIEEAAALQGGPADEITLGVAADDYEAQQLGLPCVGVHEAVIGMVAARVDVPVTIVPRGSTPASAAAADAHDGVKEWPPGSSR